jgi:hypothetical protein
MEIFRLTESLPRISAKKRGKVSGKRKVSTENRAYRTGFHDPGEFSAANPKSLHEKAGPGTRKVIQLRERAQTPC